MVRLLTARTAGQRPNIPAAVLRPPSTAVSEVPACSPCATYFGLFINVKLGNPSGPEHYLPRELRPVAREWSASLCWRWLTADTAVIAWCSKVRCGEIWCDNRRHNKLYASDKADALTSWSSKVCVFYREDV